MDIFSLGSVGYVGWGLIFSSRGQLFMKPYGWGKQPNMFRTGVWIISFNVFQNFLFSFTLSFNPFFSWSQVINWLIKEYRFEN